MNNSRKKRYIFYTSRSQHVSTVKDEVTLVIILNTPGSFPAPATMARPLHRNRSNPPSDNNPSDSNRPPQCDIVIHSTRPKGETKGWTDSARSVTPPGEWTDQQMQIQRRQRKWAAATTWCVLQKKNMARFTDERFSQSSTEKN